MFHVYGTNYAENTLKQTMSNRFTSSVKGLFLVIAFFSALISSDEIQEFDIKSISAKIIESEEDGILKLTGNVIINSDIVELWSDEATYDKEKQLIKLKGNVQALSKSLSVEAESMTADFLNKQFYLSSSSFEFEERGFGEAQIVNIRAEGKIELLNVSITSCKNENTEWLLSAEEIVILEDRRNVVSKDIWVKLGRVPIFYFPYIRSAVGDEKFSGFLAPSLKQGKDGVDLSIPYFFSLASNYDLTLVPRYIEERGTVIGAEGRYLTRNSLGQFSFSYLEKDRKFSKQTSQDTKRWATNFFNHSKFSSGLSYEIDTEHVSDIFYFEDLDDDILGSQQKDYLRKNFQLSWLNKDISVKAKINQFDNLNPLISNDYETQPNIEIKYKKEFGLFHFELLSDFSKFTFDSISNPLNREQEIKRSFVEPSIGMMINNPFSSTIFKVGSRSVEHDNNKNKLENKYNWVELSYKIFLEKLEKNRFSALNPIIKLIWVDSEKDFETSIDSKLLNLNFDTLFNKNWYSGRDIFFDRNRIVIGAEHSLYDYDTGYDIYFSFGKAFFENNEDIAQTFSTDKAPFISELRANLGKNIKLETSFEIASDLNKFISGHLGLIYEWEEGTDFQLRSVHKKKPRYLTSQKIWQDDGQSLNQVELISQWKISDQITVFGKVIRDNEISSSKDLSFGFQYSNCCLKAGLMKRKWIDQDYYGLLNSYDNNSLNSIDLNFMERERDNVYFFFELVELGRLGKQISDVVSSRSFE